MAGSNRRVPRDSRDLLERLEAVMTGRAEKSRHEEVLNLITSLARSGDHVAAVCLLPLCFHSNRNLSFAAAAAIRRLLTGLTPLEFVDLDHAMRSETPIGAVVMRASPFGPEGVAKLDVPEDDAPFVLGLLSSHLDGHVREAALRKLSHGRSGHELPFVLIRLNDWVPQVRAVARKALFERLVPSYAEHFVAYLPLVLRLRECSRAEHNDALREVEHLVVSHGSAEALRHGCQVDDREVRRTCYRLAAASHLLELCVQGIDDSDSGIRFLCAKVLLQESSSRPKLASLIARLLDDPFMPVRRAAIRATIARFPETAEKRLYEGLLDPSAAIRDVSAFELRKRVDIDFGEFYREQLKTTQGRRLAAAILGIGRYGHRDDVPALVETYHRSTSRARQAVLRAISLLARESHTDLFITALLSPLAGVSRQARDVLAPQAAEVQPDALKLALLINPHAHVRKNALGVLRNRSKYDGLYYTLLAIRDRERSVRDTARQFVSQWIQNYNRSFVKPTREEVERLRVAFEESGTYLPRNAAVQLEFLVRPLTK